METTPSPKKHRGPLRTPHTPPGRPEEMNVKAIVDRLLDPHGEHAEQKRREERDRNGK